MLADGSALIDGLALATDVNEQFGLHIDEETYNTIGGYVLGRLGRRARVGDRVEVEGRALRVEALDGLRVARVYLSAPGTIALGGHRPDGTVGARAACGVALRRSAAAAGRWRSRAATRPCRRRRPSTASRGRRRASARNTAFSASEIAMFAWMLRTVARPRRSSVGELRSRSSAISATSAVSSAASLPAAPIAMPTSAAASAGASLTPSPTMATVP